MSSIQTNLLGMTDEEWIALKDQAGTVYNVFALAADLTFDGTTAGSNVTLGTIPAGSIIVGLTAHVNVAFNSGSSDVLDVGTTSGDPDEFIDNQSITSTGAVTTVAATTFGEVGASDVVVYAKWTAGGAAATTGDVTVAVLFVPPAGA